MSGRILVTGGAGFIGSHLVRRLRAGGTDVVVLDSFDPLIHEGRGPDDVDLAGAEVVRGDVRDADDWRAVLPGVETVFHLAARTGTGESMYRARGYVDVNIGGTATFADLVSAGEAEALRRVILASSRAVYGEGKWRCGEHGDFLPDPRSREALEAGRWDPCCPVCDHPGDPVPMSPSTPCRPTSLYALTKRVQEETLALALEPAGIGWTPLRFQNVYGAGQSLSNPYTGVLSIFATRLISGQPIRVFEDGLESRDFVHVDDVVRALRAAAADTGLPSGLPIDVGSGRGAALHDVARILVELLGADPALLSVSGEFRVGDIRHARADLGALREHLGIEPEVALREGLDLFVRWVEARPRAESRLDAALDELAERGLFGRAGGTDTSAGTGTP